MSTTRTTSAVDLRLIMDGSLDGSHEEFRAWQEGLIIYDRPRGEPGRGERRPPLLTEEGAQLLGITLDRQ